MITEIAKFIQIHLIRTEVPAAKFRKCILALSEVFGILDVENVGKFAILFLLFLF